MLRPGAGSYKSCVHSQVSRLHGAARSGWPSYDRAVIWEPFVLALLLGLLVSAGLYFAYLWPSVEPRDEPHADAAPAEPGSPSAEGEPS